MYLEWNLCGIIDTASKTMFKSENIVSDLTINQSKVKAIVIEKSTSCGTIKKMV